VRREARAWRLPRNRSVWIGAAILTVVVAIAVLAPYLGTTSPSEIDPTARNRRPGAERVIRHDDGTKTTTYPMGTDTLGRDVYSRVIYGSRVSLIVGVTVALLSVGIGLVIGLVSGYIRWLDGIVMRVMDGLMSIPAILLAIALVSLSRGAGLRTVILAIVIPEIPRVVRLVRSVVLSVREEPYVEAARALGVPTPALLARHVLPSTVAPLVVQGTFICASAIVVEAILSFLGIGIPPETPTWGNIMAEGRALFRIFPHNIFFPSIFLAATVLAVNMLGDGLRDTLDPRLRHRI
jgi:peptide/nickel transport system permease protein